jgi:hypothetical protein
MNEAPITRIYREKLKSCRAVLEVNALMANPPRTRKRVLAVLRASDGSAYQKW